MNIHFTDKKLLNNLSHNTVFTTKIGSHMYGLQNSNSDTDYLSVYIEDEENRNSFMWEHHQLQYKDDGADRNFTTVQSLIRNALTGDSTINFEFIQSDDLKDSSLHWLWEQRNDFVNYNIIKSYLGLAKRDLKFWRKDTYDGEKNKMETNKKLSHFVRGVIFANNLLLNTFSMDLSKTSTYAGSGYNDFELLNSIKNGESTDYFAEYVLYFEFLMSSLRDDLNTKLNNHEIDSFMNVEKMKNIDKSLKLFIKKYSATINIQYLDYGDLLYEVLEKGLTY